jgi:Tfp pilus assembly protein PilO
MKISMVPLNLSKEPSIREKALFFVILVVMLFLFLHHVWGPMNKKIVKLRMERDSVLLQTDALQKLIDATKAQLGKVSAQNVQVQPQDPYVKKVLDRRVVDVTEEINTTADLMGGRQLARRLDVLGVDIGPRKEESGKLYVPITVNVKGRYTAIKDYLVSLENIGRPLVVRTLSLKKEDVKSGELSVKIETELYLPKI